MSAAYSVLGLLPESPMGWLVILFICLLLFGTRLPKMARNLGKGVSEFKAGLRENEEPGEKSDDDDDDDRPRKKATADARRTHIDDTSV